MSKYFKYLPLVLFSLYSIKLLVQGATFQDAPILFVLAALAFAQEIRVKTEQVGVTIEQKLAEFGEKLKKFEENQVVKEKDVQDLKTHVAGLKLSSSSRSLGGIR